MRKPHFVLNKSSKVQVLKIKLCCSSLTNFLSHYLSCFLLSRSLLSRFLRHCSSHTLPHCFTYCFSYKKERSILPPAFVLNVSLLKLLALGLTVLATSACVDSADLKGQSKPSNAEASAQNNNQNILSEAEDTAEQQTEKEESEIFFEEVMNAAPFLPKNTKSKHLFTSLPNIKDNPKYKTSSDIGGYQSGWETRIAHDWDYFRVPEEDGKVLVIDIKTKNQVPAFRYLANAQTHDTLYEPWSSSKIFAYTGAIAELRKRGMHSQGKLGQHHIADMITSINSYDVHGLADGNSNALATFFANVATREKLTALFHDDWLKLNNEKIAFRGAYGPISFEPNPFVWQDLNSQKKKPLNAIKQASDDPFYLPYRCDECGITGNKPMTTLAQAEWLKRLAMHTLDTSTQHPELEEIDILSLFYGAGHSKNPEDFAGMTLGISTMLQLAIAKAIEPANTGGDAIEKMSANDTQSITSTDSDDNNMNENARASSQWAKSVLDNATNGEWRVFQKIGWGPSETRSTSENVVLAYVILPNYKGGKAFVVAAQTAVPEATEANVALAGLKMQSLLDKSVSQLFREHEKI